jgi:hypothetical protein
MSNLFHFENVLYLHLWPKWIYYIFNIMKIKKMIKLSDEITENKK